MPRRWRLWIGLSVVALVIATALYAWPPRRGELPSPYRGAERFEEVFSSGIPYDVRMSFVQDQLLQFWFLATEMTTAQAYFDLFGWQLFVALNWPVDAGGTPLAAFADDGAPRQWSTWKEAFEVFRADGGRPSPWGAPPRPPHAAPEPSCVSGTAPGPGMRLLFNRSATDELTVIDETAQAFSHPIYDQSGRPAQYEILINEVEYDYIVENELYNVDGQIAFFQAAMRAQLELYDPEKPIFGKALANPVLVDMPKGSNERRALGAIELKLGWKILGDADIPARFFHQKAWVIEPDGKSYCEREVGLIGMHIAPKTERSPQWTWITFAHVDNLRVPPGVTGLNPAGRRIPLTPSFHDPDCAECIPNTTQVGSDGLRRTQAQRVIPIPKGLQALNARMQALVAQTGSAFQYYEMIDTQWPQSPFLRAPATSRDSVKRRIQNRGGGVPTPIHLTNAVFETYFQRGYQPADQLVSVANPGDESTIVFGTQSCVGCHSDAPIAIGYTLDATGAIDRTREPVWMPGQLSADFSWLLRKAQYRRPPTERGPPPKSRLKPQLPAG